MRTTFTVGELVAQIDEARAFAAMPADAPEGWSIHPTDPARIVVAFPPLRVRDEFALVAYQYCAGGNGNALVYAQPRSAPIVPPDACPRDDSEWHAAPRPPEALRDLRLALEGDGTPRAHLATSLACRELGEMGAAWHGVSWSSHVLIGADPRLDRRSRRARSHALYGIGIDDVTWHAAPVGDWAPHVDITDGAAIVRFVSASALGFVQVVQHEDRYVAGQYVFETTETVLASGNGGYIP